MTSPDLLRLKVVRDHPEAVDSAGQVTWEAILQQEAYKIHLAYLVDRKATSGRLNEREK